MQKETKSAEGSPRFRKSALSIRGRLIVIALLAVVPLMLDRVRLLESGRTERIEIAHNEVAAITHRGIDAQQEVLTTARALLQLVARNDIAALAGDPGCVERLGELSRDISWLNGMSIVGANGRILCSSSGQGNGLDLSDRPYFQEALAGRPFVLSDYLIDRIHHELAIIAARPVTLADGTRFVIVASIELKWVDALVATMRDRPGSAVLVVSGAGTLMAAHPAVQKQLGVSVAGEPLIKAILANRSGLVTTPGLDGVRRIYAFAPIPDADAYLAVGLDESRVLQRIEREIGIGYAQLVLFGLMVLLIAWFGGERLIGEPIRLLARTAQRFGRGDLDSRTMREEWAAEFVPLANALSDMAGKLAAREREQREVNEHLAELASIDALSSLANRRGFDNRLAQEWERAAAIGMPLGLLMIDVDHFKAFNDHYGHVDGDDCLREIAKVLRAVAGPGDFPARYGGEEFALLVPGADLDGATATAEKLRQAIAERNVAHAAAPGGQVTVSVGVAAFAPGLDDNPERLVEAADAGLYAAKRRGRNAVVAHAAVEPVEAAELA